MCASQIDRETMHASSVRPGSGRFRPEAKNPRAYLCSFFYCFFARTYTHISDPDPPFFFACKDMIDALCRCRVDKQFPNSVMQAAARLPTYQYTHSHLRCTVRCLRDGTARCQRTYVATAARAGRDARCYVTYS